MAINHKSKFKQNSLVFLKPSNGASQPSTPAHAALRLLPLRVVRFSGEQRAALRLGRLSGHAHQRATVGLDLESRPARAGRGETVWDDGVRQW